MANIYSVRSGLASDPTVWSGGAVPGQGDRVLINGSCTIEIDGDYTWGDGTSSSVAINGVTTTASVFVNSGTIRFSRSKSSSLTVYGSLGGATFGKVDLGREVDPIPGQYRAELILNAASTANTGQFSNTVFGFSAWGQDKTRYAKIQSAASNSVFTIPTPSNWAPGDWIYLSASRINGSGAAATDVRVLQSLTDNGDGTSTVTLEAAASTAVTSSRYAVNLTRNTVVRGAQGNLYGATLIIGSSAAVPDNSLEVGPCEFRLFGTSTGGNSQYTGVSFSSAGDSKIAKIQDFVSHNVWSVTGSTVVTLAVGQYGAYCGFGLGGGTAVTKPVVRPTVAQHAPNLGSGVTQRAFMSFSGDSRTVVQPACFGSPSVYTASTASVDITIEKPLFVNCGTVMQGSTNSSATILGGRIIGYYGVIVPFTGANFLFNACVFDGVDFVSGPNDPISYSAAPAFFVPTASQNMRFEFRGCNLPAGWTVNRTMNYGTMTNRSYVDILAPVGDVTAAFRYSRGGRTYRDFANRRRGTSSLAMACWYADNAQTRSTSFVLLAGASVEVRGSVRVSADYGSIMPVVSVSSPYTDTQSVTVDANSTGWTDWSVNVVNPTENPVTFTLTYTAQSQANTETATAWFDGVPDSPFVDSVRHFGYLFDLNVYRTRDRRVNLSEAEALALPVVVNHVDETITVSGPVTSSQLFQACLADLCQASNLSRPVHVTSVDGVDFDTSYTVTGREFVDGPFTDSAGRWVYVEAPNLLPRSRVQVLDLDSGEELVNVETASTGFKTRVKFTPGRRVRLRAGYAWGTTAMDAIERVGIVSASGVVFADSQTPDSVYNSLGIDGGTCTEFIPDFPNLLIDVSDEDGTTSVQRLYAWAAWTQTTGPGIAAMFRAVTAVDTNNFLIDPAIVDARVKNVRAAPVTVVGGAITRSDGSSVISQDSGPIHIVPGRAYVAEIQQTVLAQLAAMIQQVQTKVDASL